MPVPARPHARILSVRRRNRAWRSSELAAITWREKYVTPICYGKVCGSGDGKGGPANSHSRGAGSSSGNRSSASRPRCMRRGPKDSESASFDAGSGSATLSAHGRVGESCHMCLSPRPGRAGCCWRATRAPTLSEQTLAAGGEGMHAAAFATDRQTVSVCVRRAGGQRTSPVYRRWAGQRALALALDGASLQRGGRPDAILPEQEQPDGGQEQGGRAFLSTPRFSYHGTSLPPTTH